MSDLHNVVEWLESHYNRAMSVYEYDNYVRLTNGSAAMYVDIGIHDDQFCISGERYGEKIKLKKCNRDKESLLDTLSHTI